MKNRLKLSHRIRKQYHCVPFDFYTTTTTNHSLFAGDDCVRSKFTHNVTKLCKINGEFVFPVHNPIDF